MNPAFRRWSLGSALIPLGFLALRCAPPPRPPEVPGPSSQGPAATVVPTEFPSGAAVAPTASPTADAGEQLYQSARGALLAGDVANAKRFARQYIDEFPAGSRREAAEVLLQTKGGALTGNDTPVLLGAALPLTGKYARYGLGAQHAVELAVAQYNQTTAGARVEVRFEDTGSEPTRAATAAAALAQSGCLGAVGPLAVSDLAACAPEIERAGIPMVAPAAVGRAAAMGKYLFTIGVSPELQGRQLKRFAASRRWRRVGMLYPKTSYGAALADALKARENDSDPTVMADAAYAPGQTDFGAEVQSLGGTDTKAAREQEEREKNFIQERAESALTGVLQVVLPGSVPQKPSPTPKAPKRSRKKATPTPSPTPSPSLTPGSAPRVLIFDWVSEDAESDASHLDRKFGARLALLLRQQTGCEVIGEAEFVKLADEEGKNVNLLSPRAAEGFLEAADAVGVTHVVSGSVRTEGGHFVVQTRVYEVAARRLAVQLSQFLEMPPPPNLNLLGLDAILIVGHGNDVVQLASQLVFYDLRLPFLGTADADAVAFARSGEKAMIGSVFPSPFFADSSRPEVRRFVSGYSNRYAAVPGVWEASAYDCAELLLTPIGAGVRDRNFLREEIAQTTGFAGVTGTISFHGAGECGKMLSLLEIGDGGTLEEVR